MPRGGKRPGAGRPKGVPNKRTRKLTEATAEVVAIAEERGITPLAHMMSVLNDPATKAERKDYMAAQAAPYMHPRLAMTASLNPPAPGGRVNVVNVVIICVPRGAQYCMETGKLTYADGGEASPEPFQPYTPSRGLDELPAPEPEAEPIGDPTKLVVLNAHRRRSGNDDDPAGAPTRAAM